MFTKRQSSLKIYGLLQAGEVVVYCAFVGLFLWRGNELFGEVPNYIGPVLFLILFIVSALSCALFVFYQPYKLFLQGDKKASIDLIIYTTAWLFIFFLTFLTVSIFLFQA